MRKSHRVKMCRILSGENPIEFLNIITCPLLSLENYLIILTLSSKTKLIHMMVVLSFIS